MPCFGIEKGKKFAYFTQDRHGDGVIAILVKTTAPEEQAMLIESDPARYYRPAYFGDGWVGIRLDLGRSDEHTSELQSLMRISYAVFCLQKKTTRYQSIQCT